MKKNIFSSRPSRPALFIIRTLFTLFVSLFFTSTSQALFFDPHNWSSASSPSTVGYVCAWRPDGKFLAYANDTSGYLYIYKFDGLSFSQVASISCFNSLPVVFPWTINSIAWTQSGNHLAIGTTSTNAYGGYEIQIFSFNGSTLARLPNSAQYNFTTTGAVSAVVFGSESVGFSSLAAIGSSPSYGGYTLQRFTFNSISQTLTRLPDSHLYAGGDSALAFSPDEVHLALSDNGTSHVLKIFLPGTGIVGQYNDLSNVFSVHYSPNGKYLAVGGVTSGNGDVVIYSVASNGTLTRLPSGGYNYGTYVDTVHWSNDGKYLAIGGDGPTNGMHVQILSFNGTSLTLLTGSSELNPGTTLKVNWSPDDLYLAMSGWYPGSGVDTKIYKRKDAIDGNRQVVFSPQKISNSRPYTHLTAGNLVKGIVQFKNGISVYSSTPLDFDIQSPICGPIHCLPYFTSSINLSGPLSLGAHASLNTTSVGDPARPLIIQNGYPVSLEDDLQIMPNVFFELLTTGTLQGRGHSIIFNNTDTLQSSLKSNNIPIKNAVLKAGDPSQTIVLGNSVLDNVTIDGALSFSSSINITLTNDIFMSSKASLNFIDSSFAPNAGGTLFGNNHTIFLNGDLPVSAGASPTIASNIIINGQNNALIMGENSYFYLAPDVTCTLKNITLKPLLETPLFQAADPNTNNLYLNNVTLDGPVNLTSIGRISLIGNIHFGTQASLNAPNQYFCSNGHTIFLDDNLPVAPNSLLYISSDTTIDGQGHTLNLGADSQILVDSNTTLTLKNMKLVTSADSPASPCIAGLNASSKLALDNVEFKPASDFYFKNGQLFIHNDVIFTGAHQFVYKSTAHSHITPNSTFCFDRNSAFKYNPASEDKDLIILQNASASLYLDGCSLFTTHTGLRLATGNLLLDNNVSFSIPYSEPFYTLSPHYSQNYGDGVYTTAWSANGNYLAVGGWNPAGGYEIQVFSYNATSNSLITIPGTFKNYGTAVHSLAWSPNGNFLAVGGQGATSGNQIQVFSFDGTSLTSLPGALVAYGDSVNSVSWSPSGNHLAVGGHGATSGNQIQVFSFDGTSLTSLPGALVAYGDSVNSVSWSPSGNHLAVGGNGPTSGNQIQVFSFDGTSLTSLPGALVAYGDSVNSVLWNPSGNYLAVGGNGPTSSNEIQVFSFDGSALGSPISANYGSTVHSVSWNSNGGVLTAGGQAPTDDTNQIQSFYFNGSVLTQIPQLSKNYGSQVYSVAWKPNSNMLIAGGTAPTDGTDQIQLFSISLQALPETLKTYGQSSSNDTFVYSVALSPNGNFLAVGGWSPTDGINQIQVFAFDGTTLTPLPGAFKNYGNDYYSKVNSVAWSPNGNFLAVGGSGPTDGINQIQVFSFDGTTLTPLPSAFKNYGDNVYSVAWSPDGAFLAVGGSWPADFSSEIQVFSFDGTTLTPLPGAFKNYGVYGTAEVYSVTWSPDGAFLAVGGTIPADGNEIQVFSFDGTTLTPLPSAFKNYGDYVYSVAWSPDGAFLAVGGSGPTDGNEIQVFSFDSSTLTPLAGAFKNYGYSVNSVTWNKYGNFLAVGGSGPTDTNEIQIFSFDGTTLNQSINQTYDHYVNSIAWSQDGNYLAIGATQMATNFTSKIQIFSCTMDTNSHRSVGYYNSNGLIYQAAWNHNGNFLAAGGRQTNSGNMKIQVFSFDGSTLTPLPDAFKNYGSIVNSVAWSLDGAFLAVGGQTPTDGNEIQVFSFDGSTLTPLPDAFKDYGTSVNSVAWSLDGAFLAVGGQTPTDGNEIQVFSFDGSTLTPLPGSFKDYDSSVRSVAWRPDGAFLAIGGYSPTDGNEIQVFSFDGSTLTPLPDAFKNYGTTVYSVAWSPDGAFLAIGGQAPTDGNEIQVFSFDGSTLTPLPDAFKNYGTSVRSVAWSADGALLAIGGQTPTDGNEIQTFSFDGSTLTPLPDAFKNYGTSVRSVAWSPDEAFLSVGGQTPTGDYGVSQLYSFILSTKNRSKSSSIFLGNKTLGPDHDLNITLFKNTKVLGSEFVTYDNVG